MKYNIVSIDDSRWAYKAAIRHLMSLSDGVEVHIPGVNGSEVDLPEELEKRGIPMPHPEWFSVGEVGIWLSMFDCWQWCAENDEPLVVFEDDAIVQPAFIERVTEYIEELPGDWDFICLWVPPNQIQDYNYIGRYNENGGLEYAGSVDEYMSMYDYGAEHMALVYNGYGNVAMMYSPEGARKLIRIAKKGIYSPVDCFQYQEAHTNNLNGYAPKPKFATLVTYDGLPATTIHGTERYFNVYET